MFSCAHLVQGLRHLPPGDLPRNGLATRFLTPATTPEAASRITAAALAKALEAGAPPEQRGGAVGARRRLDVLILVEEGLLEVRPPEVRLRCGALSSRPREFLLAFRRPLSAASGVGAAGDASAGFDDV